MISRTLLIIGFILFNSILATSVITISTSKASHKTDSNFTDAIKSKLKTIGNRTKVSNIVTGDWDKVCIAKGGASIADVLSAVAYQLNTTKNNLITLNRPKSQSEFFPDSEWSIYFYNNQSEVVFFIIKKQNMLAWKDADSMDEFGCTLYSEAYFENYDHPQAHFKNKNYYYLTITRE